jgi:thiol-disulfide isomerase/thioredoxin
MIFRNLIFCFLFFPGILAAQGVVWEPTLEAAFKKAKSQNKPIFVEYFSPTCPYCKQVDPFFTQPPVAQLYNEGFINFKLDVDSEEGRAFQKSVDLDIYGIPYFVFFKADSTLIHAREVSANVNSVLQPGKMVIENTYSAQHYAERFKKGERGENFLAQYALFSRVAKDLESNRAAINALWEVYPENKRSSPGSWAITKKATMDVDNGFVNYWLSNLTQAKAYEDASKYGNLSQAFSRILLSTLFSKRAETFKANQWEELRLKFSPVIGADEVFGLIWENEARANLKEGNLTKATEVGNKVFTNFKTQPESLLYLIQFFTEKCEDKICLDEIEKWLVTAQHLQIKDQSKATCHLKLAMLRKNQGKASEAVVEGQKALKYAQSANIDLTIYYNFLKEL